MKVLIDSDICLDSITGRYPYSIHADKLLTKVEERDVVGVVSSESFSNLYYVIRKLSSHTKAIEVLNDLRKIVTIGTLKPGDVESALTSGWQDFEDALQHFCALRENCDSIITRNKKDYKASELPIYSPSEWLDIYPI